MTHEEALNEARAACQLNYFYRTPGGDFIPSGASGSDFDIMLDAYLEARGAVLCVARPVAWVDNIPKFIHGPAEARALHASENRLARVPLHAALSDNPKGNAS